MISRIKISAGIVLGGALIALFAATPVAAMQREGEDAPKAAAKPGVTLDYEFFKANVEPIFLKKRWPNHARCYSCHEQSKHRNGLHLETLTPGANFWTEEQSRKNFETVSKLVVPGNPDASFFPMHPLDPVAGGTWQHVHNGGRQFESKDDPDFKNAVAWIRGQKASAP